MARKTWFHRDKVYGTALDYAAGTRMGACMELNTEERISGVCAILGVDMVAFSLLPDGDQLMAVRCLVQWIHAALESYNVCQQDYRWSPAGDGGYLTFKPSAVSAKALDISFAILEKAQRSRWIPRTGNPIALRFGIHAGPVYERDELIGGTNVWGDGINMAARILDVACHSQILVSSQYYLPGSSTLNRGHEHQRLIRR